MIFRRGFRVRVSGFRESCNLLTCTLHPVTCTLVTCDLHPCTLHPVTCTLVTCDLHPCTLHPVTCNL